MLIDLHCHSRYSRECTLDPEAVSRRAAEAHLDGVCFTEINTLEGLPAIQALRPHSPVRLFVGLEVVTDHGHYLCFFPEPEKIPQPPQMWGGQSDRPWPAREVVAHVGSLGGAVIAAHPYDREIPFPAGDFIFTLPGVTAIESYNAGLGAAANELAAEAADHLRLPCVAGSGARSSLDGIGTAFTLFKREVATEAELVAALKSGQVWPVTVGAPVRSPRPPRNGETRGERRPRR